MAINYNYGVLLIKWLGTHAEYDKINVKEIAYDESRYSSPTDKK